MTTTKPAYFIEFYIDIDIGDDDYTFFSTDCDARLLNMIGFLPSSEHLEAGFRLYPDILRIVDSI